MALLEIENLSFSYPAQENTALKDLLCSIDSGEFVGIIGRNGSGKSSFCYSLAGVIPHLLQGIFQGEVRVAGVANSIRTVSEIAGDLGLVLQMPESQLSGVRDTVFEEVAFGLENQGVAREKMIARVEEVLENLDLTKHATSSPFQLSGGEQQRVALASVLVRAPQILVLDEPTTFLDPKSSVKLFEILNGLKRLGKTIVIVEQKVELLAQYCSRILVFDQGRIQLDGTVDKVLSSAQILEFGLARTRYTEVADLVQRSGLLSKSTALPCSLEGVVKALVACNK